MDLTNKIALITGSRRGIGRAIAEKLAENKATVIISATTQSGCDEAAKEISAKYGVEAFGMKADVANFEEVQEMGAKIIEKFGRIDILVNNAGITKDNLLLRMDKEEWDTIIQTNLSSVFYCTKAVIRQMMKQRYGRIINVSSVIGQIGNAGQANYAAAKAGIFGFTKSVAKEFGAKGITCNAIAPGFIETDMTASLPKQYIDNIINLLPQKRMGKPQEVADLVLFLCSDLANYITGQVLNVDGGMVM